MGCNNNTNVVIPEDKELVDFLWNRVISVIAESHTKAGWNPLESLDHAWMMAEPLRDSKVCEFPMYLTMDDDGGMYYRSTVHHQYDFTPMASCVDEKSPCRAICNAVYITLKRLDGKMGAEEDKASKFWQMWKKPNTPKVGVGVVLRKIESPYRELVLLGLRKGSHGAGQWSLPGGHMELGESFLDVCKREVKEETGIDVRGISKLRFTNDIFEEEGLHYVTLFFEADWDEKQVPIDMEPDKTEKWEWFSLDNLPNDLFPPLKQAIREGVR